MSVPQREKFCVGLTDVDECTSKREDCDRRSTECVNLPGGYECLCKAGFEIFNKMKCKGKYKLTF